MRPWMLLCVLPGTPDIRGADRLRERIFACPISPEMRGRLSLKKVRKCEVAPLASRVTSGATTKECRTQDRLPSDCQKMV